MKKVKFQVPTGMHDILPSEEAYFQKIYKSVESISKFYGFQKIDTPIVEDAEVFSKAVGISTDIVEKEMYVFKTKGGDVLALRPEGTAPIARSYIEHGMFNLPQPIKFWYFGPFFRHERPQAGRFRQFWQFGLEVFGEDSPIIDAELIQVFYTILKDLKFKNLIVEVNSIGDSQCRPYYKKLLSSYLRTHQHSLCPKCQKKIKDNPLRVLDCKDDRCRDVVSRAPQMIDHLCEGCHNHFRQVLEFLDGVEIPYRLNPYLVRGLDYYTRTVFEFIEDKHSDENNERKMELLGGGRYDALVKLLGGKDVPACGGAMGIERIIIAIKNREKEVLSETSPRIFLAQLGSLAKIKSLKLLEEFRKANINISQSLSKNSLKTQLRISDKMGVDYTLILGQKEAISGMIIIRNMKTSKQETVLLENVIPIIKKRLKK
ncbi:MAG: histidine--tRNA ligase [Patescibacteria group bacterium]|nr:histidine--tRNA ligase [Patescibacteria group bacterium]